MLYITAEIPAGGSFNLQKADVKNLSKNLKSDSAPYVTGVKWQDLLPESEAEIARLIAQRTKDNRETPR